MVEPIGRRAWFISKVDFGGMSLAGADAQPIFADGESLFVVVLNHIIEFCARDRLAMRRTGCKELFDAHPAVRIKR